MVLGRPADATVVAPLDFDAQCAHADRVFVGTVRSVVARADAAAPGHFETIVTLATEETVVGAVPPVVTLSLAGGEVGGIRQWIDGMPEFAVGERYVVFLEPDGDPPLISPVVGFNQGLYRALPDPAASGGMVVRDRTGAPLGASLRVRAATAAATAAGVPAPTPTRAVPVVGADEIDLGTFLAAIRAARRQ